MRQIYYQCTVMKTAENVVLSLAKLLLCFRKLCSLNLMACSTIWQKNWRYVGRPSSCNAFSNYYYSMNTCNMKLHQGFPYGTKPGEEERVSLPNAKYTQGNYKACITLCTHRTIKNVTFYF